MDICVINFSISKLIVPNDLDRNYYKTLRGGFNLECAKLKNGKLECFFGLEKCENSKSEEKLR